MKRRREPPIVREADGVWRVRDENGNVLHTSDVREAFQKPEFGAAIANWCWAVAERMAAEMAEEVSA